MDNDVLNTILAVQIAIFSLSFSQVDLDGGLSMLRQWIYFGSVTHEKQKIKMLQHDF